MNTLTGSIPTTFSSSTKLANFNVSNNALSGSYLLTKSFTTCSVANNPALCSSITSGTCGVISTCSDCTLLNNAITGFGVSLFSTSCCADSKVTCNATGSITGLDLRGMSLTGGFPTGLIEISALTSLYMNSSKLAGTFPSTWLTLNTCVLAGTGFCKSALYTGACSSLALCAVSSTFSSSSSFMPSSISVVPSNSSVLPSSTPVIPLISLTFLSSSSIAPISSLFSSSASTIGLPTETNLPPQLSQTPLIPIIGAAAGGFFFLLICIIAIYLYRRKQKPIGKTESPSLLKRINKQNTDSRNNLLLETPYAPAPKPLAKPVLKDNFSNVSNLSPAYSTTTQRLWDTKAIAPTAISLSPDILVDGFIRLT